MKNFFEHQAHALKLSRRLSWAFVVAYAAMFAVFIIGFVLVTMGMIIAVSGGRVPELDRILSAIPFLFVPLALFFARYLFVFVAQRQRALREPGVVIATELRATRAQDTQANPHIRRLRNVVDEMSIAAGIPAPELFVLEAERGLNALSVGEQPTNAVLIVTQGLLESLSRDELQAVIAHEFSHILHGDMQLNLRMTAWLHGLLLLGGEQIQSRNWPLPVRPLMWLWGSLGRFVGTMIQSAVTSQREYLADASAVQYTRYPKGLANALKKMAGFRVGTRLDVDGAVFAHMMIADGTPSQYGFASHPALIDRILRLEPQFDSLEIAQITAREAAFRRMASSVDPPSTDAIIAAGFLAFAASFARQARTQERLATSQTPPRLPLEAGLLLQQRDLTTSLATPQPAGLVQSIANPSPEHVHYAHALNEGLPARLGLAAALRERVLSLVAALVMATDGATRETQLDQIEASLGQQCRQNTLALSEEVSTLLPQQRLPLLLLSWPTLKLLPDAELGALHSLVSQWIDDDSGDFLAFALGALLHTQLDERLVRTPGAVGKLLLIDVRGELETLLGTLAHQGHPDPTEATFAFHAGMRALFPAFTGALPSRPARPSLRRALTRLQRLDPRAKEGVIPALIATIDHDGRITVGEAEHLRLIAAVLGCPMPPIVETPSKAESRSQQ